MGKKKACFMAIVLFLILQIHLGYAFAGDIEPSQPPGPTMKTLDEIPPTWSQVLPVSERFELVMNDEAVLDKETGLVWQRTVGFMGYAWDQACNQNPYNQLIGGRLGWRLPTVVELSTLVDKTQSSPALPAGHPFIFSGNYDLWTSTPYTYSGSTDKAWYITFNNNGGAMIADKNNAKYTLHVRGYH